MKTFNHGDTAEESKPTTEDTEETEATEQDQDQDQDRNHKGYEGTLRNGNCLKNSAHQNHTVAPMLPKKKFVGMEKKSKISTTEPRRKKLATNNVAENEYMIFLISGVSSFISSRHRRN